MTLAVVYSRACLGVEAPQVTVETHLSAGLPGFTMVGLPEAAVKESKDRVRSAILNSQFDFPTRRITVNLAPADLPKEGGRFDLPIALGILAASGQIPLHSLEGYEFSGELALSGELRPIQGALPLALGTRRANRALIIPIQNAKEAALPGDNRVLAAAHLLEVCGHLTKQKPLLAYQANHLMPSSFNFVDDFADIKGQMHAKRALEIAAAGFHSIIMVGPPGTGKTMLATRLPTIMPALTLEESLEVIAVHSLISHSSTPLCWGQRPFRAPHHTTSAVALVGGGSHPRPGEISLAHQGILFLDELPEFDRKVLEVLREPLESGTILISRAARQAQFPACFQLIAAMNPCPCGYLGDPKGRCQCTVEQVKRYHARISGPLLDRIDLQIEVPALPIEELTQTSVSQSEASALILKRVEKAIVKQKARSEKPNARLSNSEIQKFCSLNSKTQNFIKGALERLGLTARSYHRILKIARTIADLANSQSVEMEHLTEALSFRKIDRH